MEVPDIRADIETPARPEDIMEVIMEGAAAKPPVGCRPAHPETNMETRMTGTEIKIGTAIRTGEGPGHGKAPVEAMVAKTGDVAMLIRAIMKDMETEDTKVAITEVVVNMDRIEEEIFMEMIRPTTAMLIRADITEIGGIGPATKYRHGLAMTTQSVEEEWTGRI